VEYPVDVVDFVTKGTIDTSSPLAIDRMIRGAVVSALPVAPTTSGEWGGGDVTVVFIHGNLASKDWIELAAPLFPTDLRVIGLDWRGCGESDRPKATADYSNYSMQQHAEGMLAALDSLDVRFCHLATHSTGGIIAARMLLMQPQRFGRVFALDPVTPLGMLLNAEQIGLFRSRWRAGT
jgi:non-heme chloroperoxidase